MNFNSCTTMFSIQMHMWSSSSQPLVRTWYESCRLGLMSQCVPGIVSMLPLSVRHQYVTEDSKPDTLQRTMMLLRRFRHLRRVGVPPHVPRTVIGFMSWSTLDYTHLPCHKEADVPANPMKTCKGLLASVYRGAKTIKSGAALKRPRLMARTEQSSDAACIPLEPPRCPQ